jgi:hypothetical protein
VIFKNHRTTLVVQNMSLPQQQWDASWTIAIRFGQLALD